MIILQSIKGRFTRTIFQSNSTGYIVGLFKVAEVSDDLLEKYKDKTITFTGYFHELNEIDTYLFNGEFVSHNKYGEQFKVDSYERVKPEGKNAIIEFLTSGLFKGIGEKKAKLLVDTLGDDTLKVIIENPSNLILIPGITKKNIDELHNSLLLYEESYETILYLENIGFNTKDSIEIYNKYKNRTKKIIEDDIYSLVLDFNNISFKKIDIIALNNGIEKDNINRIRGALLYIMREISNTYGHTYYYREELVLYLNRLLRININDEIIDKAFSSLEKDLLIIVEDDKYYLKDIYDSELLISRRLLLLSHEKPTKYKNIDKVLDDISGNIGIEYSDGQIKAIKSSITNKINIITGGPGTGKTTIIKGIIELYRTLNKLSYEKLLDELALLAPTGRAAKRMTEETSFPASTIHRFLKWNKDDNSFRVNEYNKSKVKFIIIDESSMIDTLLMASLLKGLSVNTKIIIIGDDKQLPSVGPGDVLHDIIESNSIDICRLEKLYRQGKGSNIIELAYNIRENNIDKNIFNENDLYYDECSEIDAIDIIKNICSEYLDYPYHDFQVLIPMYKGINGIDNYNKILQSIFNPSSKDKKELIVGEVKYREGDKVIQLTNQPDDNVYNGDIGIIERIVTGSKKEVYIDFDGNIVRYTPSNFINFKLAYAISIHKAQGSEFKIVIMPILGSYKKMLYKKLVYTGITRAKSKLYLVGDSRCLDIAIQNDSNDLRRTSLEEKLKKN